MRLVGGNKYFSEIEIFFCAGAPEPNLRAAAAAADQERSQGAATPTSTSRPGTALRATTGCQTTTGEVAFNFG